MFGESNQEKKSDFRLEIVSGFNEKYLNTIIDLEKKCFPEEWQHENPYEYFKDALSYPECINIFLKEKDKIVGYLFAVPLKSAYPILKEHDYEITDKPGFFYLDNIEIIEESRGKGGTRKMIELMCDEANKRGFFNFSVHARTINGLNKIIKNIFNRKITRVRNIDHWVFGNNEPYEYIEWEYDKFKKNV